MAIIKTTYKDDMLFQTNIGHHSILMDVPDVMGGKDRGVTPPQIFMASLSSCIGAFVANYCKEHNIDATDMTVEVSFDKIANPTRLVNIKARVELPHAEIGKREEAVRRVALHCPVHESIKVFEGIDLEILDREKLAEALPA
jgi:putative redox protein